MKEILEIELNEDTVLNLPEYLTYNKINNALLVISQNTANWIGLFNNEQEEIFELLHQKKSLSQVSKLVNTVNQN